MTEKQKQTIEEIKKQWVDEARPLFDKWEQEEKMLRQKTPDAPRILDKHLREIVEIEKKYKTKIRKVMEVNLLSTMVRESNWATETLMEAPFWRNGMTPEEYDREREYLGKNFHMFLSGEYIPLWKQNENKI